MHDHVGDQRVVTVARRFEGEFARPRLARRRIARIGERARKRARQRLDVADRRQDAMRRRDEDFRRPAAICGDDRQAVGERFDAGEAERFAARRQDEAARRVEPRRNVELEAGHVDLGRDSETPRFGFEPRPLLAFAENDEPRLAIIEPREGAQQRDEILVGNEAAERDDGLRSRRQGAGGERFWGTAPARRGCRSCGRAVRERRSGR